jgi:SPP1 family predicted phage head-tail adaptor
MHAGMLDQRVTLQAPTETRGAEFGDPQRVWEDVATVWAEVSPISGREYFLQREQQSQISVRVRIRYRADVTSMWRVQHAGKVYEIESVIDQRSAGEELILMCMEYRSG